MSTNKLNQIKEVQESLQSLVEISQLLSIGLDVETLSLCVRLCESGVNPEILALLLRDLMKEASQQNDASLD